MELRQWYMSGFCPFGQGSVFYAAIPIIFWGVHYSGPTYLIGVLVARAQVESFSQNPSHAEKVVMVRHLQQQIAENLTVGKDSYCTYTVYSYNTYPLGSE